MTPVEPKKRRDVNIICDIARDELRRQFPKLKGDLEDARNGSMLAMNRLRNVIGRKHRLSSHAWWRVFKISLKQNASTGKREKSGSDTAGRVRKRVKRGHGARVAK